jgi:predicted alpha/beta hydrolase family esterase
LFAEEVLLVTSDNDPYMTPEEALSLQKALGTEMKVLHGAGHINADSGFGEWPWVKEWVLQ